MSDLVTVANALRAADALARADALIALLPRLDAMNSFVRSEVHRRRWSCRTSMPKVVYHYKREALREFTQLQLASHRLVFVRVTCRDCGGSRRYTDSYGYTHDHCWLCGSTGSVGLRFVESTLPGGIIWNTPERDDFRRGVGQEVATRVETPIVHQVGKDLTPSEVAANMNAIESVITVQPPRVTEYYGTDYLPHHTYQLWIGESSRDTCLICGSHEGAPFHGYGARTGRLCWTGSVCLKCQAQANGVEIFDVLARLLPAELLTPEITEWAARHPAPPEPPKPQETFPVPKIVHRLAPAREYFQGADNIPF